MKTNIIKKTRSGTLVTTLAVAVLIGLSAQTQARAFDTQPPEKVSANDFIELFGKLSGVYPGFRKAHARGTCAAGTFSPSKNATNCFIQERLILYMGGKNEKQIRHLVDYNIIPTFK